MLSPEILAKIEEKKLTMDRLRDMSGPDIGHFIRHVRIGEEIRAAVHMFPHMQIHASIQPITRTVSFPLAKHLCLTNESLLIMLTCRCCA